MQKQNSRAQREREAIIAAEQSLMDAYSAALPGEKGALALALSQTTLKSGANYERFAKRHGLTSNGLMMLTVLRYTQTSCTQRLIGRLLWLPKQTVGSIVAAFKKRGLVVEEPSPVDGRAKILSLTSEGTALADKVVAELVELERLAMEAVPDEDIRIAVHALDAYTEAFEQKLEELG